METVLDRNFNPTIQVTQEEILAFKMPVPQVGQPVLWHRRGIKTDRGAIVKFIARINAKSVDLNDGVMNVLHVDDPRLFQNEHQRENGSWEFTPYDLEQKRKFDELYALITEPAKPKSK